MAAKKHITAAMVKAALKRHHGAIAPAARQLKVRYDTLYERVHRNQALQDYIAALDDTLIAKAKSNVEWALSQKDMSTTRWFLERRSDEYKTRVEATHRIADGDLEALAASLGGDLAALVEARNRFGPTAPA